MHVYLCVYTHKYTHTQPQHTHPFMEEPSINLDCAARLKYFLENFEIRFQFLCPSTSPVRTAYSSSKTIDYEQNATDNE